MTAGHLTFVLVISFVKLCELINPGPLVVPTKGAIWPEPQIQDNHPWFFAVRPTVFKFNATGGQCNFLNDALGRYWYIIKDQFSLRNSGRMHESKNQQTVLNKKKWTKDKNYLGYLDVLNVHLDGACNDSEVPTLEMKEEYKLVITSAVQILKSKTIWGILRGLDSFSQLLYLSDDSYSVILNATKIDDYPRLKHRGLMLDTGRHFQPLYIIFKILDSMSYNKLNVFHWHLVDDQSFPYQSPKFPSLSDKGAYHPYSKIYTPSDVQRVIEFARKRGIRVIPEFDTPGHTRSWGEGVKNILTTCYNEQGDPSGELGPFDPSKDNLYPFLEQFLGEIKTVFPDEYLHTGGDEVDFACWESNKNLSNFMRDHNISTYEGLQSFYTQKLLKITNKLGFKTMVWEEVFTNNVTLPGDTVVHVWKDKSWKKTLLAATKAGKKVIFSSCWYLDHLHDYGSDWSDFYNCDPFDFDGNEEEKERILGGEACMWGESVNEYNVLSRIWPRASPTAEKLWSTTTINENDLNYVGKRLEEHSCRLIHRGIPTAPASGPGSLEKNPNQDVLMQDCRHYPQEYKSEKFPQNFRDV